MDFPRFLCLELRPVPTRDLHRVVLGQFVFVVGPLEETTLEDDRGEIYQVYQVFIITHTHTLRAVKKVLLMPLSSSSQTEEII